MDSGTTCAIDRPYDTAARRVIYRGTGWKLCFDSQDESPASPPNPEWLLPIDHSTYRGGRVNIISLFGAVGRLHGSYVMSGAYFRVARDSLAMMARPGNGR